MLQILTLLLFLLSGTLGCSPRVANEGIICVCNATYCDTVPPLGEINDGFKIYFTSATEPGFNTREVQASTEADPAATVVSVGEDQYQKIIGFGGAFTDAAAINIKKLSDAGQQMLLEAYFGDDGIEYNICRVPLGACDFSPRPYTLDDVDGDVTLEHFELQDEDVNYKIPVMLQAKQIRGDKPLNLFASAWTAPRWMKDKYVWHGGSVLKEEYFQLWADYHVKFFDEYLKEGIKFWGFTIGNEPLTGFYTGTDIPSMGWPTAWQLRWFLNNLVPAIKNSSHSDLKMMIHDESLHILPFFVPDFLENDEALKYVDGVGTHWYYDGAIDPDVRNMAKSDKKDIFILETETCHFQTEPRLGYWPFAADYADNIITDLQYGYNGWVEWNLLLNITGGPTHINLPGDAPIILSEDSSELYKQPTFYVIGHFSKFVVPDSIRLGVEVNGTPVRSVAFLRPDNIKVVNIYNGGPDVVPVQVEDAGKYSEVIQLSPQSITTVLYTSS